MFRKAGSIIAAAAGASASSSLLFRADAHRTGPTSPETSTVDEIGASIVRAHDTGAQGSRAQRFPVHGGKFDRARVGRDPTNRAVVLFLL